MFSDSDDGGIDLGRVEDFDSDAASGDDDIGERRRRRKAHRREREARGGESDGESSGADEAEGESAAAASAPPEAAADDAVDDGVPLPPSAAAPHIAALLSAMLPQETVHAAIARLGEAKQKAAKAAAAPKAADNVRKTLAAADAKLQAVMSAAEEMMTAMKDTDVHEATREQLLLRYFKALRRKPDPMWCVRWTAEAPEPLRPGESAASVGWLGPFTPEEMEGWRVAGFFGKKAAFAWNVNAMPKTAPVAAATVESFKPAASSS